MDFQSILNDKSVKPKEKTEAISSWILENPDKADELIEFAASAKDPIKATCIESMEYASKINPAVASRAWLEFVSHTLAEKAPRIKWESAKVIGNIAAAYPNDLETAIENLLTNSEHTGTVVRWSTAFALGEIIKLKSALNDELVPAIEAICAKEEKKSISTIYLKALKHIKK